MNKKILTLINFIWLSACSGATFDKGLNYEKTPKYRFDYDKGTHGTSVTNQKNGNNINIMCNSLNLI